MSNARKVALALGEFGFAAAEPAMFTAPGQIIRMGTPPLRLEILTGISGVEFEECFVRREIAVIDGDEIPVIHLENLKQNQRTSGRLKDLADLEALG